MKKWEDTILGALDLHQMVEWSIFNAPNQFTFDVSVC